MQEDIPTHRKLPVARCTDRTVSRMLGHRDLRSTQIYAKISNDKISEDTNKLEERIKDKFRLVGVEQ